MLSVGPVSYTHLDVYKRQRVLRAVLIVGDKGLRFETGAVEGQRPGFAEAAHVGPVSYTHLDVYKRQ